MDLTDDCGRTALIEAVAEHERGVARALMQHGASVNVQDSSGRSPLIVVRVSLDCVLLRYALPTFILYAE
jgi:hypothetical protein